MIVEGRYLEQVFNAIKADTYVSEDKGVQIFVSAGDVDSVCACQQLVVSLEGGELPQGKRHGPSRDRRPTCEHTSASGSVQPRPAEA